MQEFDTLIFDLDGTLIDTRPCTLSSTNYVLQKIGESTVNIDQISGVMRFTLAEIFNSILSNTNNVFTSNCVSMYKEYQRKNTEIVIKDVQPYPTVTETLTYLAKHKYTLAVATNKPTWLANAILSFIGIQKYFSVILGSDRVMKPKPSPEIIDLVLPNKISTSAMIVGDSVTDIISGKNAQITTCAVGYGYTETANLIKASPDFLIHHFCDLINILE